MQHSIPNLPETNTIRSVRFDAGSLVYVIRNSSLFMHRYTFFVVFAAITVTNTVTMVSVFTRLACSP
jgi:hypothetical protein